MEPTLPAAVTKAYDIVLWIVNHVGKFPRSHRFVLGERIETKMLTVLELLIRATYSREKKTFLDQANVWGHFLNLYLLSTRHPPLWFDVWDVCLRSERDSYRCPGPYNDHKAQRCQLAHYCDSKNEGKFAFFIH